MAAIAVGGDLGASVREERKDFEVAFAFAGGASGNRLPAEDAGAGLALTGTPAEDGAFAIGRGFADLRPGAAGPQTRVASHRSPFCPWSIINKEKTKTIEINQILIA